MDMNNFYLAKVRSKLLDAGESLTPHALAIISLVFVEGLSASHMEGQRAALVQMGSHSRALAEEVRRRR